MVSRFGTPSTGGRLPKSLRMRFFSVKEYVVMNATASFVGIGPHAGPEGNVVELSPQKSLVLPAPARPLLLLRVDNSATAGIGNGESGFVESKSVRPLLFRFPIPDSPFPLLLQRRKPGGICPQAGSLRVGASVLAMTDQCTVACTQAPTNGASCAYFNSTLAPAASRSFLNFSASSLLTPSFTVCGAPSTMSLASLRPRPVIARTALITSTFFSPNEARTTLNSVFSSAAAAPPAAGAAATATGAAADTPNFSSIALTRSITSTRVLDEMASMMSSLLSDMGLLLKL